MFISAFLSKVFILSSFILNLLFASCVINDDKVIADQCINDDNELKLPVISLKVNENMKIMDEKRIQDEILLAARSVGFFYIIDHNVSSELIGLLLLSTWIPYCSIFFLSIQPFFISLLFLPI